MTTQKLADIHMRDVCIMADAATQTYYAVSSTAGPTDEGFGRQDVRVFTSKDLRHWEGPMTVFHTTPGLWGNTNIRGIWAPEMHAYRGKYYLFLTFDTDELFAEQWHDWYPRVRRGSQILMGDTPLGPFIPFANHSALPADMMTLDGTLWVEDSIPYLIYCHEWVQIKDGTVECIQLTPDLSETAGEQTRLWNGSDALWSVKSPKYGCTVTDGPWPYLSRSGKLFMIWSSFSETGYTTGVAVSDTGRLRGPWRQQAEPLYRDDGGHGMIFTQFDGTPTLALHSPNDFGKERALLFELEDTGETLRVVKAVGR